MTKKAQKTRQPGTLVHLLSVPANQKLVVALAILLVYAHTLDVPFYYDDNLSLRDNPAIRTLDPGALWSAFAARIFGYYTFALNYAIHEYAVAGYHVVNIAIHLLASLVVYHVAALLLKTPAFAERSLPESWRWLPLLTALVFAVHPLQIQAVTYIVQRLASLAALFYLASLLCYLNMRLSDALPRRLLFLFLTLGCLVLAISTKQNAVTAPLAWLLVELVFFRPGKKTVLGVLAAGLALVGAVYFLLPVLTGESLAGFVDARTRETDLFTRAEYFSVQPVIVAEYLLKFLWPVNLVLNYETPLPGSMLSVPVLLPSLLHLALLAVACVFFRKLPLLAFGLLFYYTGHLVESSVIPIRDFGFDHRTYLPNFGLCLVTGWVFATLLGNNRFSKAHWAVPACLVLLSVLAWQRNNAWRDPVVFFTHEADVLQDSFRAHCMLGQAYYETGNVQAALEVYREAWPLQSAVLNRGNNTLSSCTTNFAATLQESGFLDEARSVIASQPLLAFTITDRSKIFGIQANIEAVRGNYPEAEEFFAEALALNPRNIDAISNLAKLKILTGELDESYDLFRLVFTLDPGNQDSIIGMRYIEEARQ